jgi:class 3 adenylate cyclase
VKPERVLLIAALGLALFGASAPLWWRFGSIDLLYVHYLAVGASLIIGGFICSRWRAGRATAQLMLLAACLYFLPAIGYGTSAIGFTLALFIDGLSVPVTAQFVVAFPEGVLRSTAERVVIGLAWVLTIGVRAGLFFFDPQTTNCPTCPANLAFIAPRPEISTALDQLGALTQVGIAIAVLALVVRRWVRATRPERRVLSPVFVAFLVLITAAIVASVVGAGAALGAIPVPLFAVSVVIEQMLLVLLPVSFGIGVARGVLARSAVGNLMVRIGQGRTAQEIERDVAWALSDPTARLVVGDVSRMRDMPPDRVRFIEGARGVTAALVHDPSLSQFQPELVDAVASATRLALENQRLESEAALASELPIGLAERLQREGNKIGATKTVQISVLMSDIRGYSSIAETASATELATQLNEHRVAMNRVIANAGGTVMQYAGDSVFAVFGAPEPARDHAARAVAAAISMQSAQSELNNTWSAAGRQAFGLGIGVTSGEVAAVLSGSAEHLEYSVVGDVVNLAQRLQAWAQPGQVVISSDTHDQIDSGVAVVQLPTATVKGRRAPVSAFRLGTA